MMQKNIFFTGIKNNSIAYAFGVFLLVFWSPQIGQGFLGNTEDSQFYTNIDKNYQDLKDSMYLYEAANQGNGSSAAAFNDALKKLEIDCTFQNYEEIRSILSDEQGSGQIIKQRCKGNGISTTQYAQIVQTLKSRQESLVQIAKKKIEVLNTISRSSIYADGNIKNSSFDLIKDMENIEKEIFGMQFEKYVGDDNSLLKNFLKDVTNTRNNNKKENPLLRVDTSSANAGQKGNQNASSKKTNNLSSINLKSLKAMNSGLQFDEVQYEIYPELQEINEEKTDTEKSEQHSNIDLACIDTSTSGELKKFDIQKAFNKAIESGLIDKENAENILTQEAKQKQKDIAAANSGAAENNVGSATNTGKSGQKSEKSQNPNSATIGAQNQAFPLKLDTGFGDYSKEKDRWGCNVDDLFCVKFSIGRSNYGLLNGSYFSLSKVLVTVAKHLEQTNKNSLIQSRHTTNNFELGLIIPSLSKLVRGLGIEVQWKPIPNLDTLSDKNDANTWGKDRMMMEYFKLNQLDLKRQNDLAAYEHLEAHQQALINSLGLGLDAPKNRIQEYEKTQKIMQEKQKELQTVTRNQDQILLREDLINQIEELEKFANYIGEFTTAINNEIVQMKKIPIQKN